MKSVDEIKSEVYEDRVKFIEKAVAKAITHRANFVEISQNYVTSEIKDEMEENGYTVEVKELDPSFVVVSW